MNEMEMQLSRLFNAAVGEPPNQVTPRAARRQAMKRRIIACVGATAVLAVAGSIGLAVSANAIAPHRVTSGHQTLTRPKYYFDEDFISVRKDIIEDVVRSTSTGAITGRVRCPGPNAFVVNSAATENQTFFIECQYSAKHHVTDTRIYRFQVTSTGRVTGFGLARGGNLRGFRGANLGVSADGSELAIDVAKAGKGPINLVFVINTKTGSSVTWHADPLPGGIIFHPADLSFALGGSELAVFGFDTCAAGVGSHCENPGEELRVVSAAAKGGNLSSGRRVFTESQAGRPTRIFVNNAFLSPDGKTVTAGIDGSPPRVVQFSVATGKKLRTLFTANPADGLRFINVDPTRQFVLYNGTTAGIQVNGWIDHGSLHMLKPAHTDVEVESW